MPVDRSSRNYRTWNGSKRCWECTWPGCGKENTGKTDSSIVRHYRRKHLGEGQAKHIKCPDCKYSGERSHLKRHRAARHGDPGSDGEDENDEDEAENSTGEFGGPGESSSSSQRRDQTTSDGSLWPRIRSPILDSPPPAPPVSYSREPIYPHPQPSQFHNRSLDLSTSSYSNTTPPSNSTLRQFYHSTNPYSSGSLDAPMPTLHQALPSNLQSDTQDETHYSPYVAASSTHLVHRTVSRPYARYEHYPYDPHYRRRHGSPLQNTSIECDRQPLSSAHVDNLAVASARSGIALNGFDIPTSPPDSSFQHIPRIHLTSPPEHNPSYPPSMTRNRIRYSNPHNATFDPDSTNPALHDHFPPTSSFQHAPSSHNNVTDTDTSDFDHLREYSPDTLNSISDFSTRHGLNPASEYSLGKARIPLSLRRSLRYHDLVTQ